jgi:hypothetical protein
MTEQASYGKSRKKARSRLLLYRNRNRSQSLVQRAGDGESSLKRKTGRLSTARLGAGRLKARLVAPELWRLYPGNPRYQVSTLGRVRSLLRMKPIAPDTRHGYPEIGLCDGRGKRKKVRVSILVLETYRGPRPSGLIACHRDDVRANNRLSNLYWGTYSDNGKDAIRNGRIVFTQERREKLSKAAMGNRTWVGRKHSEETKLRMSESQRRRHLERKTCLHWFVSAAGG